MTRLLGTAGAPVNPDDADTLRRRETIEVAGTGADYDQAFGDLLGRVPDGWALLHVRRDRDG